MAELCKSEIKGSDIKYLYLSRKEVNELAPELVATMAGKKKQPYVCLSVTEDGRSYKISVLIEENSIKG